MSQTYQTQLGTKPTYLLGPWLGGAAVKNPPAGHEQFEWRMHARVLARELTELDEIDPDIVEWIVRR